MSNQIYANETELFHFVQTARRISDGVTTTSIIQPTSITPQPGSVLTVVGENAAFEPLSPTQILEGDTRDIAGLGYAHGDTESYPAIVNCGSGAISLSSAGNDITITCAVTNPDFVLAGIIPGDEIMVVSTLGVITTHEISSVLANVLTLVDAAPTINNYTGIVFFKPNAILTTDMFDDYINFSALGLTIKGFYYEPDDLIHLRNVQSFTIDNCLINCVPNNMIWMRINPLEQSGTEGLMTPATIKFRKASYIKAQGSDTFFSSGCQIILDDFVIYVNQQNGIRMESSDGIFGHLTIVSRTTGRLIWFVRSSNAIFQGPTLLVNGSFGVTLNSNSYCVFRYAQANMEIRNCTTGIHAEINARVSNGFGDTAGIGLNIIGGTVGVECLRMAQGYFNSLNTTNTAITPWDPAAAATFGTDGAVIFRP